MGIERQITQVKQRKPSNYNLVNAVIKQLNQMQLQYEQEVCFGVMSCDIWLEKYSIAIEIDGPSHFVVCEDDTLQVSGTTDAKHRVLKSVAKHFY